VQWLYRWSRAESELQGPVSSAKMAELRAANLLNADVLLQRVVSGADEAKQAQQPWISITQIDFRQPHLTAALPAQQAASSQQQPKKRFKF